MTHYCFCSLPSQNWKTTCPKRLFQTLILPSHCKKCNVPRVKTWWLGHRHHFAFTTVQPARQASSSRVVSIAPQGSSAFEKLSTCDGIQEYCLKSNGLQVLLKTDSTAPVATVMVTYRVGSRNESLGETGSTHLLEHMLFKGSKNYNQENGKLMSTLLENVGAIVNANTWLDRTSYYECVPRAYVEEALKMEADRMHNALLRQVDLHKEMWIVGNEYENDENDSIATLDKEIWATAFQAHPYRQPTIGWRWDIENSHAQRLKEFYQRFYYPNNATLIIVGDIQVQQVLHWIEQYFKDIAPSKLPIAHQVFQEPPQRGPRRLVVRRIANEAVLGMAWKSPRGMHRDSLCLSLLANILCHGKNSRLYQSLVDAGMATVVNGWQSFFRDPALFFIYACMGKQVSIAQTEERIIKEIKAIKQSGVSLEELSTAKTCMKASLYYSRDGTLGFVENLNEAVAMGDWKHMSQLHKYLEEISREDIQRVAQRYLVSDQSTVGWLEPQQASSEQEETNHSSHSLGESLNGMILHSSLHCDESSSSNPSHPWILLPRNEQQKVQIASQVVVSEPLDGMELVAMKTPLREVVRIQGSLVGGEEHGRQKDWNNIILSDVMVEMLGLRTHHYCDPKYEISKKLQNVGAGISFHSQSRRLCIEAVCLKEHLPLVLSLLAEQLRFPIFLPQDLQVVRGRLVDEIESSKDNISQVAEEHFLAEMYPVEHPNYVHRSEEYLEALHRLTCDDIADFHSKYGLGGFRLVAVGDIPTMEWLQTEVYRYFGDWKRNQFWENGDSSNSHDKLYRAKPIPSNGIRRCIQLPQKESVDVLLGQPLGISENHPDYYAVLMAMHILSGNGSSRLMQRIREQQGLTYGIYGGVGGTAYGADGYWNIHGTFSPALTFTGLGAIQRELDHYVENGIEEWELQATKATIQGNFQIGLATSKSIASAIRQTLDHKRPLEWIDDFPQIIESLTLEQVNSAIQKYIRPKSLVTVICGKTNTDN
ncbi:hypothetical protein GpartN1_g2701.t1 [Galdieria partita]|uniref:Alpha-MPP n=1 Tax=Galdieria partita TaxID=83374 RepID=A0A9C7PUU4_9RHOD|nr:hypothetical protein GpartN1_g2701.t1 [Galdieria partita]